jgi:7-cyano-7-deazaguanine synthase
MKQQNKAYILLSGGQDSFVCLLWALENFELVEAISILYGQRHSKELEYAQKVANYFKVKHAVYDVGDFLKSIAQSSLLDGSSHNTQHVVASNLPASFVPNRNGLFLTIASNHAFMQNEKHIYLVTGTCETDYSGYPDCRDNYIKSKQIELSLGLDRPVTIHTPLMWKSKAQTFEMADNYGKLKELNELTLTCYNGNENMNEWGRGCGDCPSCLLRKKGYEEFINGEGNNA